MKSDRPSHLTRFYAIVDELEATHRRPTLFLRIVRGGSTGLGAAFTSFAKAERCAQTLGQGRGLSVSARMP